jgi:hypothetical protein|tara:strand:+ start:5216 stop:6145 length:930 start_codon:yes stop_codon:yes gene_type:complete
MGIDKITNVPIGDINKVSNVEKNAISTVNGVDIPASFTNTKCVSRSITTGVGQSIRLADTNGKFNFRQSDAYSISFWIKVGWSTSLNTNIHLFASAVDPYVSYTNLIRIYYREDNNRIYYQFASGSPTRYSQNFWLMQVNSGNYAAAYQASGLGSSYWSASNRGNVGDDNFTLITITQSATANAGGNYAKMYWNGTDMGSGYYANGNSNGAVNMTTADRQITVGSNSWSYAKSGDSAETKYNDLSWWNKQLTASEVAEIYNEGTPKDLTTHSAASNLKGYYKFEGDGTDSSGNGGNPFVVSGNSNFENI